jgi:hypothetical protein
MRKSSIAQLSGVKEFVAADIGKGKREEVKRSRT